MESDASNGTPRKRFDHTTDKPNTSGNHSAAVKPEGKDAASPSGVSVTVLTLDASATSASRQRNKNDLFRELEQHAQKQILACQNMGYFHRGSRAAENVLSLKETVSPNAFHPPAFFTRHVSREERLTSRDGASRGGEDERRSFRRLTHPGPAGKLSVPRLMLQDRQDQAARRTLPSVSGSSLQVMLAHTHAK
nr:hypothetical protein BaRGS_033122 [Batillaria attramentaria]